MSSVLSAPETAERLRILVIGGSRSRPSRTRALLDAAEAALERCDVTAEVWDVGRIGRSGDGDRRPASTGDLRAMARRAHAFVIATPTYHNSYSGLIKHALDHLDHGAVAGKAVALMATCGRTPSPQAVDHLRIVTRALGATAIPSQVIATETGFGQLGQDYRVIDDRVVERVRAVMAELVWFAHRFRRPTSTGARSLPALYGNPQAHPEPASAATVDDEALRLSNGDFPDQIMRAVRYIRENFSHGQLSLDRVASEACMSRYHFSRTFKRETGTRFIDFLTTVRLAEACSLLTHTNQSITSIAFGVGYRDLSHFERTFKKEFGFSPSRYRSRVRAGVEVPPQLPWAQELAGARVAA
ncbi:MAG TPA: helix-turn-helix domain-containing protein [Solirubrobacteraceae bacterium]|nr:helix-turn-helix domain-containing protein [Solirubrobacteraceae bacterium]